MLLGDRRLRHAYQPSFSIALQFDDDRVTIHELWTRELAPVRASQNIQSREIRGRDERTRGTAGSNARGCSPARHDENLCTGD
jgi:hypothetical protein